MCRYKIDPLCPQGTQVAVCFRPIVLKNPYRTESEQFGRTFSLERAILEILFAEARLWRTTF